MCIYKIINSLSIFEPYCFGASKFRQIIQRHCMQTSSQILLLDLTLYMHLQLCIICNIIHSWSSLHSCSLWDRQQGYFYKLSPCRFSERVDKVLLMTCHSLNRCSGHLIDNERSKWREHLLYTLNSWLNPNMLNQSRLGIMWSIIQCENVSCFIYDNMAL